MTGVSLTAREYKLLLDAASFKHELTLETVNAFWKKRIGPVVEARLGRHAVGKSGSRAFKSMERRKVLFWDTNKGVLAANSYSLRQRDLLSDDDASIKETEISLKLRTPDLFVAAGSQLPAATSKKGKANARTKLEEDIGPLAVKPSVSSKKRDVSLPVTRSTRNRFSLSTKQEARPPRTFGELQKLYPTLKHNLEIAHAKLPAKGTRLRHGTPVREFVFEGARADLGEGFTCDFAFTIWCFGAARRAGSVEISYKCALRGGSMPLEVAQRALDLFLALQTELGKLIEAGETSKTALALPKRVGAP